MIDRRSFEPGAAAAGAVAAIAVAAALVTVRDTFGNTNMALVLVVVIVAAAALGGRFVGAVTSVAAALAFNFFHTQPYRTLAVDNSEDITTIVLLLVVGLIVGELANLHRTSRAAQAVQSEAAHHLEHVAALVAEGKPVEEVWQAVKAGLVAELGLQACWFEPAPFERPLPSLRRSGRLEGPLTYAREGFALPEQGAQLTVEHGGRLLGRLVLVPSRGHGVPIERRRVAVALADNLAVSLAKVAPARPLV
jgi:hypothetical protein